MVALKLVALNGKPWNYEDLAGELGMSVGAVHAAVKRAQQARILRDRTVNVRALEEFLEHGIRYAFFAERGGMTRGMPTGIAAPPLSRLITQSGDLPVWPDPHGALRGYALEPLYGSAPAAARKDPVLYELLALVDVLREGAPREQALAGRELHERLRVVHQ